MWREFCRVTAQHGYKYLTIEHYHRSEKLLWIGVLCCCIGIAMYMIWVAWKFSTDYPTLTVLESSSYPLWNIPFPAVTVCSANQVIRSKALQLSKEWLKPEGVTSEDIYLDLQLVTKFIEPSIRNDTGNLYRLQNTLELNNVTVRKLLYELSPSCEKLISKCVWKGRLHVCRSIFNELSTYDGHCCTFNYRGFADETITDEIHWSQLKNKDQVRTTTCGYKMGLSVLIDNQIDEYYSSTLASKGVKVLIHNPSTYPDSNAAELLVSRSRQAFIGVNAIETYSTDTVEQLPITQRRCRLQQEASSQLMKNYSYHNCLMECRKNNSVNFCGCHNMYYPTLGSRRTCNMSDVPCLAENNDLLQSVQTSRLYEEDICNCLPECWSLHYNVELTVTTINSSTTFSANDLFENANTTNHCIIHVFFNDLMATRYRMDILIGWQSLVATYGGILGLMMGFSLINFVEIFYFLLRPVMKLLLGLLFLLKSSLINRIL